MGNKNEEKTRKTKANKKKKTKIKYINLVVWIFATFILTAVGELLNLGNIKDIQSFFIERFNIFILNYVIFLAITSLAFLFKKTRFMYFILSSMIFLLYTINYVVESFRGTPLIWADIYSINEAIGVANKYIKPSYLIFVGIVFIMLIILGVIIWNTEKVNKKKNIICRIFNFKGIPLIILSLVLLVSMAIHNKDKVNIARYDLIGSYAHNGFLISFVDSALGFKVDKPQQYTKDNIENIKDEIIEYNSVVSNNSDEHINGNEKMPNIIMIQLESFIDPYRLEGINILEDPIPTIRNIGKNYSSGFLDVPTYGGGTVRTEFEVLTGLSTDYLPAGEIPNNNVLKNQAVESIAHILKEKGYETSVVHNYYGNFYNRNTVYPNLGFDNFISLEYMNKPSKDSSQFPEDIINLEPVEQILSNTNKPQFIYNITAESHGTYSTNYEGEYTVSGDRPKEQINELQNYFNKLKGVDQYINSLITYLKEKNEPTVLIMFSDHLPSLNIINAELDNKDKYKSEYYIWDNMGLMKEKNEIEAYQLTSYVLDKLGIKNGIIPNFHNIFKNKEDYQEKFKELQYDILFGNKYIYNGNNPYKKTDMNIGIKKLKINNAYIQGDSLIVNGENFTHLSKIFENGKEINTEFINENTLIGKNFNNNVKNIDVRVVGYRGKYLSKTNEVSVERK